MSSRTPTPASPTASDKGGIEAGMAASSAAKSGREAPEGPGTGDRRNSAFATGLGALLHTLGFALWLGGLIALGAVVAPNIAGLLQSHPEIGGNAALKDAILNGVIGESFRMFNYVAYVCAGLMLLADYLGLAGAGRLARTATLIRAALTLIALGTVAYQGIALFPAMDSAQASGHMAAFDQLHSFYETLGMAQMALLVLVAIATAARSARASEA